MAKLYLARFMTEVAPPQIVSLTGRRLRRVLDTIAEEEKEACAFEKSVLSVAHVNVASRSFSVQSWVPRESSVTSKGV